MGSMGLHSSWPARGLVVCFGPFPNGWWEEGGVSGEEPSTCQDQDQRPEAPWERTTGIRAPVQRPWAQILKAREMVPLFGPEGSHPSVPKACGIPV